MAGVALMGTPEIYFQVREGSFEADDSFADAKLRSNLGIWVDRFVDWIDRFGARQAEQQDKPAADAA